MLIEATHAEETRVAIVEDSRLVDFDYESNDKKSIKGNVYLAKVVRVEPSLQAAFVDYGGNRHGFVPFGEIHPDYYRIPVDDRKGDEADAGASTDVEVEAEDHSKHPSKRYKIQEVIKSRQILLVQAMKDERGGKGAAMTTYISLAGRYCVLMPNADNSGGVSRKITDNDDRKRLKKLIDELGLPEGVALIVRTAGMDRSRTEIKKDLKYLTTLWGEIREAALGANAPSLVYEEAGLINRCIRDLYTRDIDEIIIEGEEGYKQAKHVMRKIMPSHAKKVQKYQETDVPLFFKYAVERQINDVFQTHVRLKSGGYLVIHTTEALVSIDVNSGKSTRERHIDSTAYHTNLEAADETARQLRLRDLAGLIVIDFIDMVDARQNAAVERRLKDAVATDRARIQIGRISNFGLLEMSRQRLRPSVLERSAIPCHHCAGTGFVRSPSSVSLQLLRLTEEELALNGRKMLTISVDQHTGFYLLNEKRTQLSSLEDRYGAKIELKFDTLFHGGFQIQEESGAVLVSTLEQMANSVSSLDDAKKGRRDPKKRRSPDQDHGSRNAVEKEPDASEEKEEKQAPRSAERSAERPTEGSPQAEGAPKERTRRRRRRGKRSPRKEDGSSVEGGSDNGSAHASPLPPPEATVSSSTTEQPKPHKSSKKKGWWQRLIET